MEIILVYLSGHVYLANWQHISGQIGVLQWVICCAVECVEVRPSERRTIISMQNIIFLGCFSWVATTLLM